VAAANGCGFWDAQAAMGGDGAMGRWGARKPPLAWTDLLHLSTDGQAIIGDMLADAILAGYDRWVASGSAVAVERELAAEIAQWLGTETQDALRQRAELEKKRELQLEVPSCVLSCCLPLCIQCNKRPMPSHLTSRVLVEGLGRALGINGGKNLEVKNQTIRSSSELQNTASECFSS
jgi:hypothetical protein